MVVLEIRSKTLPSGTRRGQTVYYANQKAPQRWSHDAVVERIVRETSLSEGDIRSALISLSNVVCEALEMGVGVDLAELGYFRVMIPSRMMDTPEEVTVTEALKSPKVLFTPKRMMLDAAKRVEVSIDHDSLAAAPAPSRPDGQ